MSDKQQTIKEIGVAQIMQMLPHRYPLLLVDKVCDVVPGISGTGFKNVTVNEPYFVGHFPENPIMPGVLQVEAMAQTSGVIILAGVDPKELKNKSVLFMTINDVKFRKPVVPGDVLEMRVEHLLTVRNVHKFKGISFVCGQKVCECTFSAMIYDKQ